LEDSSNERQQCTTRRRRTAAGTTRRHRDPRYGVDELSSILRARADQGLPPNVVTDDQLRTIADEVAGVARYGIQALRAAAELATERGHHRVRDVDLEEPPE